MYGLRLILVPLVCAAGLACGAYVNREDPAAASLVSAARWNQVDAVERLLSNGTDVSARDVDGRTALHMAAQYGHLDLAETLVAHGAAVNAPSARGGDTPLFLAVGWVGPQVAEFLLHHGADVSARTDDGWNSLHSAAAVGKEELKAPLRATEHLDLVRLLLDRGAEVNVPDASGATPLFFATLKGHLDVMKLLLDRGADVNARSDTSTALIIAVRAAAVDAVELLLSRGADVSIKPRYRPDAMEKALERGDTESLIAIRAKLNASGKAARRVGGQEFKCDVPEWVPIYPGTSPKASSCSQTPEGFDGRWEFTTHDAASTVLTYFRDQLRRAGFAVELQGDGQQRGMIRADRADRHRYVVVGARTVGDRTEGMLQVLQRN